jgi:hypothetical protein
MPRPGSHAPLERVVDARVGVGRRSTTTPFAHLGTQVSATATTTTTSLADADGQSLTLTSQSLSRELGRAQQQQHMHPLAPPYATHTLAERAAPCAVKRLPRLLIFTPAAPRTRPTPSVYYTIYVRRAPETNEKVNTLKNIASRALCMCAGGDFACMHPRGHPRPPSLSCV